MEKKQPPKDPAPQVVEPSPGKFNLSFDMPKVEYVQCEVCGHKNPVTAGICEMCSNYLFDKQGGKR